MESPASMVNLWLVSSLGTLDILCLNYLDRIVVAGINLFRRGLHVQERQGEWQPGE